MTTPPDVPRDTLRLIVIGGSAGGIQAISDVLAGLPPDLPAAVCVVLHMAPYMESHLPSVLGRESALPVVRAEDGAALAAGRVYVAVPDHHLVVEASSDGTHLRLTRGPKENRTRPAIDPLFRSAGLALGAQVIGVVVSGALDDGTAGLWAVRDRGGLAVVQDPADATVVSMPASAIAETGADYVLPASEIGPLLGRLAREPIPTTEDARAPSERDTAAAPAAARRRTAVDGRAQRGDLTREVLISQLDEEAHERRERYGDPSRFSCPDCGGVLWDVSRNGGPLRFRCETGHAHSPAWLAELQTDAIESALWIALRAIEDRVELARVRAVLAERRGDVARTRRFTAEYEAAQGHGTAVRALLRQDGRAGIRPRPPQPPDDEREPTD